MYVSNPGNANFYDLSIEYEQKNFTEQPIYCLTNNIIERLKVSLNKRLFDNRIYESNPWNADLVTYLLMVMKFWSLHDEYIV